MRMKKTPSVSILKARLIMFKNVLLVECRDIPGLVHAITGVLFKHGMNITMNQEFVDGGFGSFFMRTEFEGPKADGANALIVGYGRFGQTVAPRVRVGEQVGRRLYLQLSQQFGAQSLSELTAEYQLTRRLRLQGRTAQGPGSSFQRSLLQRVERAGLNILFFFSY